MPGTDTGTYTKYSKLWKYTTNSTTGETTRANYATTQVAPSAASGNREPTVINDSSKGETGKFALVNNRSTAQPCVDVNEVASQYVADYNRMVTSVDKYNGFYIGRYELTENGERPGTVTSRLNWYELYNQCLTLGNTYTESGMIYGNLWDATLQWLAYTGSAVGTSSVNCGFGNYVKEVISINNEEMVLTIKPESTSVILEAGQTTYTKRNNICELAGNLVEWTQECSGTTSRVTRGGYYNSGISNANTATRTGESPMTNSESRTSRACIYIYYHNVLIC